LPLFTPTVRQPLPPPFEAFARMPPFRRGLQPIDIISSHSFDTLYFQMSIAADASRLHHGQPPLNQRPAASQMIATAGWYGAASA